MSICDIRIGQIILHVKSGLVLQVVSAETGAWQCIELYGRYEGRPATVLLHQLPEFRGIGQVGY